MICLLLRIANKKDTPTIDSEGVFFCTVKTTALNFTPRPHPPKCRARGLLQTAEAGYNLLKSPLRCIEKISTMPKITPKIILIKPVDEATMLKKGLGEKYKLYIKLTKQTKIIFTTPAPNLDG